MNMLVKKDALANLFVLVGKMIKAIGKNQFSHLKMLTKDFVPHYFFIDETGHYDLEEDKKHLDNAMCKIFCTENNNISIKQINEWNAKPNSEKKYFAGNEARSMETFKFVPRTKNLDTELNELFDNL
jgi:hypothetical protein